MVVVLIRLVAFCIKRGLGLLSFTALLADHIKWAVDQHALESGWSERASRVPGVKFCYIPGGVDILARYEDY